MSENKLYVKKCRQQIKFSLKDLEGVLYRAVYWSYSTTYYSKKFSTRIHHSKQTENSYRWQKTILNCSGDNLIASFWTLYDKPFVKRNRFSSQKNLSVPYISFKKLDQTICFTGFFCNSIDSKWRRKNYKRVGIPAS